jgi:hypothetical protein
VTPEQALVSAINSEADEYAWKHQRQPDALAHQFGVQFGWMTSRCGTARWNATWWAAPDDAPRCEACSELSAAGIEREARAISALVPA